MGETKNSEGVLRNGDGQEEVCKTCKGLKEVDNPCDPPYYDSYPCPDCVDTEPIDMSGGSLGDEDR